MLNKTNVFMHFISLYWSMYLLLSLMIQFNHKQIWLVFIGEVNVELFSHASHSYVIQKSALCCPCIFFSLVI